MDKLIKARTNTEKWWFNGGSGRYTRTTTLPYLAQLARDKNKSIEVTIQIMNPSNPALCSRYANYRNSLRSSNEKNKKTCESVQIDLIATIVAAYMWKSEQPLLKFTIGLKNNFSLFRTDLSSYGALITKEDPREPAILYERDTFFYDAQVEDMRQSLHQIEQLDMSIEFVSKSEINEGHTEILLRQLKLYELIQKTDLKKIISHAIDNKNPYA